MSTTSELIAGPSLIRLGYAGWMFWSVKSGVGVVCVYQKLALILLQYVFARSQYHL